MKNIESDVLGQALQDYVAGEKEAVLKVYSDIADPETLAAAYFFRDYEQMPDIEKDALAMCRGAIADLGAGAGSHALILQDRGLKVTAIDISAGACAVMKQRGIKHVQQNSVFDLGPEKYDTILMLMNGIGLVGDLDGLTLFLQNIKRNLKPGGQIIVDSSDISYMYYDEDGALSINLNADYHGIVNYQMTYKEKAGDFFKWLFIDYPLLHDYALQEGFACKFIQEDEHDHFLVQLLLQE